VRDNITPQMVIEAIQAQQEQINGLEKENRDWNRDWRK